MKNIRNTGDIPKEYFGVFKIELVDKQLIAYNYKKIVSITDKKIILSYIEIIGENLKVKELKKDILVVIGKIKEIKMEKYGNI